MKFTLLFLLISLWQCGCQGFYFTDYVYAQQWPAAFCIDENSASSVRQKHEKDSCHLAKNITTWTNHGLWPSVNETYPNYCNKSWPLVESTIYPLEDQMRARWPSFAGEDIDFWQHEWDKHGTCAASVPLLYGPYNYFKFALQLNERFNFLEQLAASPQKITPTSAHCYKYSDFTAVFKQLYKESVILGCVWHSDVKQQHIAQVEICFDKQFKPTCTPNSRARPRGYKNSYAMPYVSPCRSNEEICYYPIGH